MSKENLESRGDMVEEKSGVEKSYQRYLELGGIINEKDYQNALERMKSALDRRDASVRNSIRQAVGIAEYAGIKLNISPEEVDPRIVLYVILCLDVRPEGVKYDQRLFREALRISEDIDALNKLKAAYHTNRPTGTYCPLCGETIYNDKCS